jgi:hypothetical protein
VREVYLDSAEVDDELKVVNCSTEEGAMATPEVIYERIMAYLLPLIDK